MLNTKYISNTSMEFPYRVMNLMGYESLYIMAVILQIPIASGSLGDL
jgi:hypothetical protein